MKATQAGSRLGVDASTVGKYTRTGLQIGRRRIYLKSSTVKDRDTKRPRLEIAKADLVEFRRLRHELRRRARAR